MNIFSQPVPGFWSETLGQVDTLPLANRIGAYFFMCQDPNYEPYAKRHCQNIFSDYRLADEKPGIDSYVNPFTENLMQHVDGFDPTGRPPDITITVPVAINAEPLQGIENTITQIDKAAKTSGPIDVLVWANAKFNPKDARSQSKAMIEAEKNYENLQKLLGKHQTPNIRYITGLQVGPENVMRMSDIRFSYMSVLLVHARRGGYEPNHPVLWVDADTTFLSKNAFSTAATALASKPFAHLDTEFSVPTEVSGYDPFVRAFVYNEIYHRCLKRKYGIDYRFTYPEESGLAFTLSTYLKARGVKTASPYNEAPVLVRSFANNMSWPGAHNQGATPDFDRLIEGLPTTKLISSGRSAIALLRRDQQDGLMHFRSSADSAGKYTLYCDMTNQGDVTKSSYNYNDRLLRAQFDRLLRAQFDRLDVGVLSTHQQAVLIRLARRLLGANEHPS